MSSTPFSQWLESFAGDDYPHTSRAHRDVTLWHAGQRYNENEPYTVHLDEVALELHQLNADDADLAAGLLHDCMEDQGITREELSARYSPDIARRVWAVTGEGPHRHQRQRSIVEKLHQNDDRTVTIKLSDRFCNLRRAVQQHDLKRMTMMLSEVELYRPVFQRGHPLLLNRYLDLVQTAQMICATPSVSALGRRGSGPA